jgi:hypothetical protein
VIESAWCQMKRCLYTSSHLHTCGTHIHTQSHTNTNTSLQNFQSPLNQFPPISCKAPWCLRPHLTPHHAARCVSCGWLCGDQVLCWPWALPRLHLSGGLYSGPCYAPCWPGYHHLYCHHISASSTVAEPLLLLNELRNPRLPLLFYLGKIKTKKKTEDTLRY